MTENSLEAWIWAARWARSPDEVPGEKEVGDVWFPAPVSAQGSFSQTLQLGTEGNAFPWGIRVSDRLWLAVWPQEIDLASLNLPGRPSPIVYFEVPVFLRLMAVSAVLT